MSFNLCNILLTAHYGLLFKTPVIHYSHADLTHTPVYHQLFPGKGCPPLQVRPNLFKPSLTSSFQASFVHPLVNSSLQNQIFSSGFPPRLGQVLHSAKSALAKFLEGFSNIRTAAAVHVDNFQLKAVEAVLAYQHFSELMVIE